MLYAITFSPAPVTAGAKNENQGEEDFLISADKVCVQAGSKGTFKKTVDSIWLPSQARQKSLDYTIYRPAKHKSL